MKKLYRQLTRKQAGVIFGASKRGEIKISKNFIAKMYEVADFYGYDDNGTKQLLNDGFKAIVDTFFNDRANTQTEIDKFVSRFEFLA